MRVTFLIPILFLLSIGCSSRTEDDKVNVPLGEVGVLVDKNDKVLIQKLLKQGTYTLKDSSHHVISFPVFVEKSLSASFSTSDSMLFTGYLTIHYILDTTRIFEMYNEYRNNYYEMEYEPNLIKIFREIIVKYDNESLRNENSYNQFYDSLSNEINRNLSKEYLFITDLKIDSVIKRNHKTPFK